MTMTSTDLVTHLVKAFYLVLWLSLPVIVVAAVVGTVLSVLQALTQIQEQTLAFAVKLIAVWVTLLLMARWMGGELHHYAQVVLEQIVHIK